MLSASALGGSTGIERTGRRSQKSRMTVETTPAGTHGGENDGRIVDSNEVERRNVPGRTWIDF